MFFTGNPSLRYTAFALVALMAATRFHHFGSALSLPDASLAVFFLAGLMVAGTPWFFALLLAEAGLIDYLAIRFGGVSDWCVSPAYLFLAPTYAAMWLGGRVARRYVPCSAVSLLTVGGILFAATGIAFLISNSSFYLFSGRYDGLGWAEYAAAVAPYYAPYLSGAFFYSAAGYAAALLFKAVPGLSEGRNPRRI